jgi:DNA mismatch repair protein MutS2
MLAEISRLQRETERAKERAQKAQHDAELNADRIRARLNAIEDERNVFVEQVRDEARKEVEQLRAEVRRLRNRVVASGGSLSDVREIESEIEKIASQEAIRPVEVKPVSVPQRKRPIQVGDTVRVKTLNSEAEVGAIDGNEVEVQIGRMRMKVKISEVERVRAKKREVDEKTEDKTAVKAHEPSPGIELDMRGMNVEEGVTRVEDYLERASRAGLPFVRIIHGKGTGVLRKAVREAIKGNLVVKSFETGLEGEGGDGVTVVKLVT